MKKILIIAVAFGALVACKENTTNEDVVINDTVDISQIDTTKKQFPTALSAVFEAHGGLDNWKKMNNLCFQLEGRGGTETHTTDLHSRKTKIEHKDWSIGYDGVDVWLLQNKEDAYSGNARFYHNLMFYFYAMPFILADDGIVYDTVPDMELDGKTYKGIQVGYNDGVGDSPKDEYILFYDPATNKMAWLGYTVTFGKSEKSESWKYIKYADWKEHNGLLLPEKLTWYTVENNKPVAARNDMIFSKITVSDLTLADEVFAKPEAATISALE